MITLKTLSWSNMFSYGADNSINLEDQPVTQILGANGHGKSSIPLVLEEVLFSKNSKGIKKTDVINRNIGTNKYNASIEFSTESDLYKLSISRTGATQKVVLLKNGVDISSHTATETFKQIEEIFGLDSKTFSQIVYQNNSSSLQFLTATDTNRKKFLIDLLSLERYITVFEKIKLLHKSTSDELIKAQTTYDNIKSWVDANSSNPLSYLEYVIEPEKDFTVETAIKSLEEDLKNITSINKRITTNNHYIESVAAISSDNLMGSFVYTPTDTLIHSIGATSGEIKLKKALLTKLHSVGGGSCPTCFQEVNPSLVESLAKSTDAELVELTAAELKDRDALNLAIAENKKFQEHQKLVEDFEKFSAIIDNSIPKMLLDKSELQTKLLTLQQQLDTINASIKNAKDHNTKATVNNTKIDTLRKQLKEESDKLITARLILTGMDSKFSVLEVLKKAFSTNGLLAYKIENSVKELQSLTNSYLTELSDGRFQLTFLVNNDKLNVIIVDEGKHIEITALSAGELARVTTSTLLAIRKLMTGLSKTRLNVLFLDETIDVLDTFGKERLIEILLKEEYLNTFLISHGYSHPLIAKVTAVKENGISRLDYAS